MIDWLRNKKISVVKEPDGTHAYELDGISVEHHNRIFDLYSPCIQRYLSDLVKQEGVTNLSLNEDADSSVCVLAPKLNLISLNAHILKHLMGHGIGLRQFCDMARAYHTLSHAYDGDELAVCYQHCGLQHWSQLLHSLLIKGVGMPQEDLPYVDSSLLSPDTLIDRVMAEGNFGKYTSARVHPVHSVWMRKMHTGMAFLENLRFSLTYAPREAFGLVGNLFLGNMNHE